MLRLAAATLLALSMSAPSLADPWPIRRFQVVEMSADEINDDTGGVVNDTIDMVVGAFSDDPAGPPERADQRAEIAAYLGEVAAQLEAWNFPPPALGRVVELEDGELAYRVYLVETGYPGLYTPPRGGEGALDGNLRLNRSLVVNRGRIDLSSYATIAHELFHAVQYSTQFFRVEPGLIGQWITEGQAAAVGRDLARMLRPGSLATNRQIQWGRRDYSLHLAIARYDGPTAADDPDETRTTTNDPTYETSSFWRYLAELDHRRRLPGPQQPPGIEADDVHYGYLAYMLSRQPAPRDCLNNEGRCPEEIEWLNAGLLGYQRFQQSLRRIYPQFTMALAAYGAEGGRVEDELDGAIWRSNVIGDCRYLSPLTPDARSASSPLRLRGVSASCVIVTPEGFDEEVSAVIDVRAADEGLLNQIIFGVAGDRRSASPVLTGEERNTGVTRTSWSIRIPVGRPTALVFANVDHFAQATRDNEPVITVTIPGSDTSASREAPRRRGRQPSTDGDEIDDRIERAIPRVTPDGPASSSIDRREQREEMRIRLHIVPDAANAALDVNAGMGGLEQALGFGRASQEIIERQAEAMAAGEALAAIEGADIELVIPLIDYGFTGTINEAEIYFSRPEDHRLEALGPRDSDPGPRRDMRSSGSVTIEEYAPEILRGRFSGDLVDPTENLQGMQPSYTVVRSVEGRFWIAAPWREDERLDIGPSASMEHDAMEDMVTIIPGLPPGMEIPGLGPGSGSEDDAADAATTDPSESSAASVGGCDCSCAAFDRLQEISDDMSSSGREPGPEEQRLIMCSMQCMGAFAACVQR